MVHELIDLFYASRWHDVDAFARAATERLGFPVTSVGLEILARLLGVRAGDTEEALWRARSMPEEELRAILALPATEVAVSLRGREYPAVLISLFGQYLGSERYLSRKVLEVVRAHTVVFAVSGEAPLTKGELELAPGSVMRVFPVLGDSFHDPYIETILIALSLPYALIPSAESYVRANVSRFLTFSPEKLVSTLFDVSRRAEPS